MPPLMNDMFQPDAIGQVMAGGWVMGLTDPNDGNVGPQIAVDWDVNHAQEGTCHGGDVHL